METIKRTVVPGDGLSFKTKPTRLTADVLPRSQYESLAPSEKMKNSLVDASNVNAYFVLAELIEQFGDQCVIEAIAKLSGAQTSTTDNGDGTYTHVITFQ